MYSFFHQLPFHFVFPFVVLKTVLALKSGQQKLATRHPKDLRHDKGRTKGEQRGLVKVGHGLFGNNEFAAFEFIPSVSFDFLAVNFDCFKAKHVVIIVNLR